MTASINGMEKRNHGYIATSIILAVIIAVGLVGAFALDSALVAAAATVAVIAWLVRLVIFYRIEHPRR